jgi:hypothetical protein
MTSHAIAGLLVGHDFKTCFNGAIALCICANRAKQAAGKEETQSHASHCVTLGFFSQN